MQELDRIEHALAEKPLSHQLFERCAQDLLTEIYPGLTPISGGTDWGRDADIHTVGGLPARLLATTARKLEGVRKNMLKGIASMKQHRVPFDRIILANCGQISQLQRHSLSESAKKQGAIVDAIYDRGFFASRLRRDGEWRSRLLGLSADPITLSRMPSDLAESPWAELPLVGRNRELEEISAAKGDLVISGRPGVGKTRVLTAVQNVYFVDQDAAIGRLADDLRLLQPEVLVVDDAGGSEQLIRQLVRLRFVEPDVNTYRIIAVCWPDEIERVNLWLSAAQVFELDLLERTELDQLLLSMRIMGQLARSEILDQAEGRAGWAVALGDILLRAQDASSLLSGKALLGRVERYLRRAALPQEATDLLATVAAVGEIPETELGELASELGVSRPQVVRLVADTAKSGLVEVRSQHDQAQGRNIRRYGVRPPMLADVLVAERAFMADVPGIDLRVLVERWPAKLPAVAESAIDSALLGASGARSEAEHFFRQSIQLTDLPGGTVTRLAQRFARIDRRAAQLVSEQVRATFEAWKAAGGTSPRQIEPIVELSFLVARWYLIEDGVELLLDAALVDQRPTNPNPGHPLRKLADLAHEFHPELPHPRNQRTLVARVAEHWIELDRSEERWTVYGHAAVTALSLRLRSMIPSPGDPSRFQIIDTVADAGEIRRIYEEIWPPIRRRLGSAPPSVGRIVIEVIEEWLRVGRGFGLPIGQSHPQASTDAARELGAKMFHELVPLATNHRSLAIRLREIGERFEIPEEVPFKNDNEIFFTDVSDPDNWKADIEQLEQAIRRAVESWADEDPSTIVQRLLILRTDLQLANVRWPDRVWMACKALADTVTDPLTWADLALEHGLFPEASPFLERAIAQGVELSGRLTPFLSTQASRWATITAVLANDASQPDRQQLLAELAPGDYRLLQTMYLRQQLSRDRSHELLTKPRPTIRAAAAAAMFAGGRRERNVWSPGDLESEWLEAVQYLDPGITEGFQDYEAQQLTQFLASRYPDRLTYWVQSRIEAFMASEKAIYDALPHPTWETLYLLPMEYKDELWSRFSQHSVARWLLGVHLVGEDIDWIEHALDHGLMTTAQALDTYNGMKPHPSIEQLARLLIPRGVDPHGIAFVAQSGSWMGEASARYAELIEQFQTLAESEDEAVATVGRVGVEMFAERREEALAEERRKRIRGEL